MKDEEVWERDEIESPCTKVCLIHPQARICTGCYRTMDEISRWGRLTPEARRSLMDELPTRAGQIQRRRGGRAARTAG